NDYRLRAIHTPRAVAPSLAAATAPRSASSASRSGPQKTGTPRSSPGALHEAIRHSSLFQASAMEPETKTVSSLPSSSQPAVTAGDDLAFVNVRPEALIRQWAPLSADERYAIEARVRRIVRVRDDFVQIPFPRLASTSDRQIAAAVESYKRQAAIVDARLSREVTLQLKATALADVCDRLWTITGVHLSAGPRVADQNVPVFCHK